jgi:hypothetical protein
MSQGTETKKRNPNHMQRRMRQLHVSQDRTGHWHIVYTPVRLAAWRNRRWGRKVLGAG